MTVVLLASLATWDALDSWTVVTAALAAMACALPGNYLLLRRQSMMGDALSHTVLPGIAAAFLVSYWLLTSGWITEGTYRATWHTAMFAGAVVVGLVTALLTETVQKLGRVESSAALGVVFTTLFAVGLILIRASADHARVDLDPDCVLYGSIETAVLNTVGGSPIPWAAVLNGAVLLLNLALVVLLFKELRISTFDPALAVSLGVPAGLLHYGLMAVTAVTLVAAFESVGSILVIAMLIVPPACAYVLTDRLGWMIVLSLVIAAASAALGHVLAIVLPPLVFARLNLGADLAASTAGMMAVAAGLLLAAAVLLSPRYGLISRAIDRLRLSLRIAAEDLLGLLFRFEERHLEVHANTAPSLVRQARGLGPVVTRLAVLRLIHERKLVRQDGRYQLTEIGRQAAAALVRSHRLWESYMSKHFGLADVRLHESAERVEHYLNPELRDRLAEELDRPDRDPHGRSIP
jgi:manganese/zinc/iron transport system permease protein